MAKKSSKNSRFVVDLGDIPLTPAQKSALAGALSDVAMRELARIDAGPLVVSKIPPKWELQGMIARLPVGVGFDTVSFDKEMNVIKQQFGG
ncbi:MAG: hypothetical protein ACK5Z2_19380 [Bacteroidota bacterium]|jgi:hypothetical protein